MCVLYILKIMTVHKSARTAVWLCIGLKTIWLLGHTFLRFFFLKLIEIPKEGSYLCTYFQ